MSDRITAALEKIHLAEKLLQEAKNLLLQAPQETSLAANHSVDSTAVQPEMIFQNPSQAIAELLSLAQNPPSEEETRRQLKPLLHSEIGDRALDTLMRFNWARLTRQVNDYLQDPIDPYSFVIAREVERQFANVVEKKIFLEAKQRNPVPITLRIDPEAEEQWKIYSFSL